MLEGGAVFTLSFVVEFSLVQVLDESHPSKTALVIFEVDDPLGPADVVPVLFQAFLVGFGGRTLVDVAGGDLLPEIMLQSLSESVFATVHIFIPNRLQILRIQLYCSFTATNIQNFCAEFYLSEILDLYPRFIQQRVFLIFGQAELLVELNRQQIEDVLEIDLPQFCSWKAIFFQQVVELVVSVVFLQFLEVVVECPLCCKIRFFPVVLLGRFVPLLQHHFHVDFYQISKFLEHRPLQPTTHKCFEISLQLQFQELQIIPAFQNSIEYVDLNGVKSKFILFFQGRSAEFGVHFDCFLDLPSHTALPHPIKTLVRGPLAPSTNLPGWIRQSIAQFSNLGGFKEHIGLKFRIGTLQFTAFDFLEGMGRAFVLWQAA